MPEDKKEETMDTTGPAGSKDGAEGEASNPGGLLAVRKEVEKVIVHPLVLLSVVDHYNRMRKVGHSR